MIDFIKDVNYEYLLELLSAALKGVLPEAPGAEVSLDKVLEYAKVHEVANIIYLSIKQLGDKIPPEISGAFRQEYWKAVTRDNAQKRAYNEITSGFHTQGIYTIEVQGTVVKNYYPERHLRMMSDIDLIIPFERLIDGKTILEELGYNCEITHDGTDINATKDQLPIEIHTDFFDNKQSVYKMLNNAFSYATLNDDFTATVPDEIFYLFHLLHSIKHATEFMGVGIRRIVDLYYLDDSMKGTLDYVTKVLRENGVYDVYEKLIKVKNHWFCGLTDGISDDFIEFENEILSSGTHGTEDIYFKNKFRKDEKSGKKFVKIRYFIRFIFPEKEKLYTAHPKLFEKKVPVFFCWFYRWFYVIFKSKKIGKIKTVFKNLKLKFK